MKTGLLLRVAAGLTLFTCLGHTAGTFMPIPAEQVAVAQTHATMKATPVPMPIGKPQSYADIFFGNNIAVSLFLLISGLGFLVFAGKGGLEGAGRRLLLLNSLGMAGVAIISSVYFFPLPAACTGLAAVLGFVAARKLS